MALNLVLRTFAQTRIMFEDEVVHNVMKAAKSYKLGKAFMIMEGDIHNLQRDSIHEPESLIDGRHEILDRFDGIILEAKTSDNFIRTGDGLRLLTAYRQSISSLLNADIEISELALHLELDNQRYLAILNEMEIQVADVIIERVTAGYSVTGLNQINALIPFCREQILNARFFIEKAIGNDEVRYLLDDNLGDGSGNNLSTSIKTMGITLESATTADPQVADQARAIIAEIGPYLSKAAKLQQILLSKKQYHQQTEVSRDRIVANLDMVDRLTVKVLHGVGTESKQQLGQATKAIYLVALIVVIVTIIGAFLTFLIAKQMAKAVYDAQYARKELVGKVALLDKEIVRRGEAESEVLALNHNLEEVVKLRTRELASANIDLEAMINSMSHDLRTPLRGIAGFSYALLEDYGEKLDNKGVSYLTRVQEGCVRMGKTIDSILELSRLARCQLSEEKIELSAIAESVVQELGRNSPERCVDIEIAADLFVNADPQLMRALLESLFDNAWKFTSRVKEASIKFGSFSKDDKQIFYVKDNGVGFNMDYAEKLFGAFQRLHPPDLFEGAGIGLAVASRIVSRYGGQIWAEGDEGNGAAFYFSL